MQILPLGAHIVQGGNAIPNLAELIATPQALTTTQANPTPGGSPNQSGSHKVGTPFYTLPGAATQTAQQGTTAPDNPLPETKTPQA